MHNIEKVGVYARVSTSSQDCQNQLIELRRYCQAKGWQAVEFIDNGLSGALDQEKRPALKALMTAARRKQIDAIVVWDFSRLARSLKQLVEALDSFRSWGVSFITLREGVDTETANGRLMFGIFASLAEFERELIRERVLLGLKKATLHGKVPGPIRKAVDVERLKEMASKGLSLRSLAGTFGVSKDTIRRLLHRAVANPPSNLPPAIVDLAA